VCQRTSLQSRSRNHGGLTSSALGCTCVCASRKSPFHRHTFAPANRSGGRQPAVGPADVCVMGHHAHVLRQTVARQRSGGRQPAVGPADVCVMGHHAHVLRQTVARRRSGGREPAVVCGNAFARAITETYRKLRPLGLANLIAIAVAGEASVVFRVTGRWHCEYTSANHGALRPPAFVLHECTPAGDLRFPLHARNLTTGGSRPPLLAVDAFVHRESRHFTGKRSPLQTGAAGVSLPWVVETHLQGRYRIHAGDRLRCASERHCSHGRVTTGG
jgi:hypothetical protein